MAEQSDTFIELEDKKFQEDPAHPGEMLLDEEGQPKPFIEPAKPAEEEVKEEEKEEEEEGEEKKEEEDELPDEPLVRKSAKDYILERKEKKIKKLESEKEEEIEEDFEDDIPKTRSIIQEEVEKAQQPLVKTMVDKENALEKEKTFSEFNIKNDSNFAKKVERYMDAYPRVPVRFIVLGLAAKASEIGAKRSEADKEAKKDISGGHSKRPTKITEGNLPDIDNMTLEQQDELAHKVKTGQAF